jgi:hypothetical protein
VGNYGISLGTGKRTHDQSSLRLSHHFIVSHFVLSNYALLHYNMNTTLDNLILLPVAGTLFCRFRSSNRIGAVHQKKQWSQFVSEERKAGEFRGQSKQAREPSIRCQASVSLLGQGQVGYENSASPPHHRTLAHCPAHTILPVFLPWCHALLMV